MNIHHFQTTKLLSNPLLSKIKSAVISPMEREGVKDEEASPGISKNILIGGSDTLKPFTLGNGYHGSAPHFEKKELAISDRKMKMHKSHPKIGDSLLNSNSILNYKPKVDAETLAAPLSIGPIPSRQSQENSRNLVRDAKGQSSEDPIKDAAESETKSKSVAINQKGNDRSRPALPRMNNLDAQPLAFSTLTQSLPRGLPCPIDSDSNQRCSGVSTNASDTTSSSIATSTPRESIPIDEILFGSSPVSSPTICDYVSPLQEPQKNNNRRKSIEAKYECTTSSCTKVFPSRSRLRRHLIIHTGQKPFECQYEGCERKFSRRDNMMQHARTHTGGNQCMSDSNVSSGSNR